MINDLKAPIIFNIFHQFTFKFLIHNSKLTRAQVGVWGEEYRLREGYGWGIKGRISWIEKTSTNNDINRPAPTWNQNLQNFTPLPPSATKKFPLHTICGNPSLDEKLEGHTTSLK